MTDLAACSTAIGALAALLRTGFTTREALVRWSAQAPESLRPDLERLRRRLLLGETVESAVLGLGEALGDDAASVATVLAVHARLGGDAGRMLDRLAQAIEVRRAGLESARAAAAGATLSARLVASLPFAFVPLAPLARAPLFDAVGLALLGLGISLGAMGMVWMSRLVPRPPASEDGAALVADLAATVLAEGASVPQVGLVASRHWGQRGPKRSNAPESQSSTPSPRPWGGPRGAVSRWLVLSSNSPYGGGRSSRLRSTSA